MPRLKEIPYKLPERLMPVKDLLNLDEVLAAICETLNVTPANLKHANRGSFKMQRQAFFFFARLLTTATWGQIGARANRDHPATMKAAQRFKDFIQVDDDVAVETGNKVWAHLLTLQQQKIQDEKIQNKNAQGLSGSLAGSNSTAAGAACR